MFRELTDELLDLRARTLGRTPDAYALTFDCCSCSCTTCWPQPFCIWGGG